MLVAAVVTGVVRAKHRAQYDAENEFPILNAARQPAPWNGSISRGCDDAEVTPTPVKRMRHDAEYNQEVMRALLPWNSRETRLLHPRTQIERMVRGGRSALGFHLGRIADRGAATGEEPRDRLSFAELVARAKCGDSEAARWLIERYESAIRRQVRFSLMDNRLRRVLEETDVCQSVMGQFFTGLGQGRFDLDGPEKLVGLLKQMVRNKITDQARYWRAGRRDYLRNVSQDRRRDPVEPMSPEPTPSRVVADVDFLAAFESRLSDWERTILALRRQGMAGPRSRNQLGGEGRGDPETFERALDDAVLSRSQAVI